jgi:hypothetical protein
MISLAIKPLLDFRRQLVAFASNARGLAAVEFAIILPVMLVTLFGVIGTTATISIDRKVTLIARTLSDLTSQGSSVTDNDIANFFAIGNAMLAPYRADKNPVSGGPLKAVITELYVDPNSGVARVQWSKPNDAASSDTVDDKDMIKSVGASVDIPSNLIGKDSSGKILPNQYFILSDVRYKYAPSILPGIAAVPLKEITYTRPRLSKPLCVLYAPSSMSDPCPKI